jgi:tetratricopeptide (TPR) repeat protein
MRNIVFFVVFLIGGNLASQTYKQQIYSAFLVGDMGMWEKILSSMEQTYKQKPSVQLLEQIVEVQYGLIGYLIGSKQKDKADKVLIDANKNLEKLMKGNNKNPRYWAYKSAFTGFSIGIAPYKAPFLGPRSFKYIDEAMAIDARNPYVLNEKANGLYYAPAFAGGDKKLAVELFKLSITILETRSDELKESWYYLMAKTKFANILLDEGKTDEALKLYNEIYRFEPRYTWVAEELRPNAIKFQEK